MKWIAALLLGVFGVQACTEQPSAPVATPAPLEPLQSGSAFLTPETRALQNDAFANPGLLWVDQGQALFHRAQGERASCAACHGDGGAALIGAAASFPQWDAQAAKPMNLEQRINACRERHQGLAPLAYESDDLLALTAYVARLSHGAPLAVELTPDLQPAYDEGRRYFTTRRGQFNISCTQCHDDHWGRRLRGDTISQGHGNGFPAYRLEWENLGSLHRRFHDCDAGVRAAPQPLGSDAYVALELFLAVRASGLPMETPAVRR